MITVPYSLLCVKIETGFFFALLILPKLRWFSTADWQVGIFLFALYVQLHSIEIIAKKAVLHLVTHHLHKKRSRIAALYTKKPPRTPPQWEESSTVFAYRVCCGLRTSFCTAFYPHQRYFRRGGTKIFRSIGFAIKGCYFATAPKSAFS